jgi:glycosyltransferase involved in cell wall biosynthesis
MPATTSELLDRLEANTQVAVSDRTQIAVVIPCYRERDHVGKVIEAVPAEIASIICVDDCCPDGTGKWIEESVTDPRVRVLFNDQNLGVGGAMKIGYRQALAGGADIVVKLDGDGQMDPALIAGLIEPIRSGRADYTKGNRFFNLENLASMPRNRTVANAVLSFVSKFSTGYWNIFDPNNGFTAIHAHVLRLIPLDRIDDGYFFESDMLFRLNTLRAVVVDVPMKAVYGAETSHLNIYHAGARFGAGHCVNFVKRIFYNYYLRGFSVASIEWLLGPVLLLFGVVFGTQQWIASVNQGVAATSGTVMLAALPTIVGIQLLLSAIDYDVANSPSIPLHTLLSPTSTSG